MQHDFSSKRSLNRKFPSYLQNQPAPDSIYPYPIISPLPRGFYRFSIYILGIPPQDASGSAALAQALLEGGLIAIEVGGVDFSAGKLAETWKNPRKNGG